MESPADRLKKARIQAGYSTAADAARAMQIPPTTYENYENDDRGFANHAPRFARFFKVNLVWLMEGKGPMTIAELEKLFTGLPPEGQVQALDYIEMLHTKFSKHAS